MRLDDVGASNIEVRRGGAGGKAAIGGGLGLGGLILVVIVSLLSGNGGGEDIGTVLDQLQTGEGLSVEGETVRGDSLEGQELFGARMMTLLDGYWADQAEPLGFRFVAPSLVVFDSPTQTGGCGVGQPAAGPFYCPADQKVYIDFGFYQRLEAELGFEGDFAMAYVLAHEYGHHVQNLLGVMDRRGGGNAQSVRVELQADCLAGHGPAGPTPRADSKQATSTRRSAPPTRWATTRSRGQQRTATRSPTDPRPNVSSGSVRASSRQTRPHAGPVPDLEASSAPPSDQSFCQSSFGASE
ncbi:MAG: neutral zinc metallopeptidase [Microthrixaceae bacterium]